MKNLDDLVRNEILDIEKDSGLKDDTAISIDDSIVIKLGGGTPEMTAASTPSLNVSGEINHPIDGLETDRPFLIMTNPPVNFAPNVVGTQ